MDYGISSRTIYLRPEYRSPSEYLSSEEEEEEEEEEQEESKRMRLFLDDDSKQNSALTSIEMAVDQDQKVPTEKEQLFSVKHIYLCRGQTSCAMNCSCALCVYKCVNSFQVAYFLYFGANFPVVHQLSGGFSRPTVSYCLITRELLAEVLQVLEARRKLFREQVPSLKNVCLYSIKYRTPSLSVNLPFALKEEIRSPPPELYDMIDRKMLRAAPGNSFFRVFTFPTFLMRHMNTFATFNWITERK